MKRVAHCKQCGRHKDEVGQMSRRGLCRFCSEENLRLAAHSLSAQSGPGWNYYRLKQAAGMAAYLAKQEAVMDAAARAAEQSQAR